MAPDARRPAYVQLDQATAHVHKAHGQTVGVASDDNGRDTRPRRLGHFAKQWLPKCDERSTDRVDPVRPCPVGQTRPKARTPRIVTPRFAGCRKRDSALRATTLGQTKVVGSATNVPQERIDCAGPRARSAASWAGRLLVERADDERGVVAAEPEGVRDGDRQIGQVARHVRDVVEIAVRVGLVVVDRRRRLLVDERLHGEDRLDGARRAEAMAGRALRRGDGELLRVLLAERELDHARLGGVAERRRGRVRVHVADLGRVDARVGERHRHRARRVLAGRIGLGHVRRVGRHAVADELGVDLRAPRPRVLELLEHEHGGGLAHHEPVALVVERARRMLRIVVAPRERAHRVEAGDADLGDRRLGAAGEHHVRAAEADRVHRVADRHVRRRARGALAHQRPLRPELDRDPACAHVRNDRRDRERAHAVGAAREQHVVALLVGLQPADARRDRRAEPRGVGGDLDAGVGLGLARRGDDHLREAVHAPRGLAVDPDRRVEVLQLAREVDVVVRVVERGDLRRAGLAGDQRRPRRLHVVPERADHAEARDHHAPRVSVSVCFRHYIPSPPSTSSTSPVMNEAASEARKRTAPAIS